MSGPCPMLWEGLDISRNGIARPCCAFAGGLPTGQADAAQAMESPIWRSWRESTLRGDLVGGCQICERMERLGGTSDRQIYRRAAAQSDPGRPADEVFVDATRGVSARRLSLHLGNLCNLHCRMCNANASSRIAADPVHRAWSDRERPFDGRGLTATGQHPWSSSLEALDRLLGDGIVPVSVQFSGGEPLLFPVLPRLLDRWIERGVADTIELSFATNGTRLDGAMLARLGRFRRVSLAVSVDGVGLANDYLRSPSVWREIEATVAQIRGTPRLNPWVAFTLSAANLFEAADVAAWASGLGLGFRFGIVEVPRYLALDVMPPAVKAAAAALAEQAAGRADFDPPTRSALAAIAQLLREGGVPFDPARLCEFVVFMGDLDRARGERMTIALPRLVQALNEEGCSWATAVLQH